MVVQQPPGSTAYDPLDRIAREPDAFEAFYRDHVEAVQRFVARRVSDPHLAADLTADVFLAAVDSAAGYDRSRGPVVAWLYGVGRNAIAAEARRRARELHAVRRIEGHRLVDAASLLRIEERLDAERESRRVHRAIAELPEDDRALLELVSLDGLSIADAARVLGVKPATARVRLHRSRARVTARLHDPEAPEAPERALPVEVHP
jgi:RNA polymerase sigma factor (sigma-70 family)